MFQESSNEVFAINDESKRNHGRKELTLILSEKQNVESCINDNFRALKLLHLKFTWASLMYQSMKATYVILNFVAPK